MAFLRGAGTRVCHGRISISGHLSLRGQAAITPRGRAGTAGPLKEPGSASGSRPALGYLCAHLPLSPPPPGSYRRTFIHGCSSSSLQAFPLPDQVSMRSPFWELLAQTPPGVATIEHMPTRSTSEHFVAPGRAYDL